MHSKISIVTISFNQIDFLKDCINSIHSQNYPNLEHIIVDPGSTDGSREYIESLDLPIVKVFEKDEGPADGLNKGFAKSTGDILYFLNSDDLINENALAFVNQYFKENLTVDVIYGGGFIVDAEGNNQQYVRPTYFSELSYIHDTTNLLQQSFFFRKSAYEKAGGFNNENRICWDGELFFKMKQIGLTFSALYLSLGKFRIYEGTITGDAKTVQQRQDFRVNLIEKTTGFNRFLTKKIFKPFYILVKQISSFLIYFKTKLFHKKTIQAANLKIESSNSLYNKKYLG